MPTFCSMRVETASTPMRDWARGPSGTLTASTPASFKKLTFSSIFSGSQPLGGTISTEVTNLPSDILFARRAFSGRGVGHLVQQGDELLLDLIALLARLGQQRDLVQHLVQRGCDRAQLSVALHL